MSPNVLLSAEHISVRLGGRPILEDISLSVAEREFVCIVGPSGCGKTTLLRVLAGLLPADHGHILFANSKLRRPVIDLAVVFQDYGRALLPWRTLKGNVLLAANRRGKNREKNELRAHELLCKVGLDDYADKYPLQLSGGMQQRLQIARALAQEPRMLIMDEPFGALDAFTRQELQDELLALSAQEGQSVLFITHDLEEAIYLGDRVIALDASPGRIAEVIDIDLPRPRNQLTTPEHPHFLEYRHHLFRRLVKH